LKTISGLRPVASGSITFDGQDISKMQAHDRVALGISQAPEGRGIFPGMSVLENLEIGKYFRKDRKHEMKEDLEKVYHLFPRLKERAFQAGGTLSGGEQQMLAIGRALMARPKVLLLDEPSMGLAPMMIANIFKIITEINTELGTTILLVEQNAQQALQRAHRAYVLETGKVVKEAKASDLLNDPDVRAAYLGTGAGAH
jgi:branched-chain amino acid transport system ATP-binding protein